MIYFLLFLCFILFLKYFLTNKFILKSFRHVILDNEKKQFFKCRLNNATRFLFHYKKLNNLSLNLIEHYVCLLAIFNHIFKVSRKVTKIIILYKLHLKIVYIFIKHDIYTLI